MFEFPLQPQNDPMATVYRWLKDAESTGLRNPNAMSLATCATDGRPSARMVLLKSVSDTEGYGVFFTDYRSRKAREIAANARAAGVLYWAQYGRQLRFEGLAVRSPPDESDRYFESRPLGSQINAWVSEQSEPIDNIETLQRRSAEKAGEFGDGKSAETLGRPPFWGGFRLWFDAIEFWAEGEDRLHRRLRYERRLEAEGSGFAAAAWSHRCLQP